MGVVTQPDKPKGRSYKLSEQNALELTLVCALFSCAPDFVKLEADDVESILLTQAEDAEVDKAAPILWISTAFSTLTTP